MTIAIIVDVETSSLYGEVIELAYAEVAGTKISDPISMRFKPEEQFDARAVAVHRILPSDVELCPPASTAPARLPEAGYWIGHHITYDWERLGRPDNVRLVCTCRLSELVWPKLNTYKLSSLYVQLFGISEKTIAALSGLHGAATDVRLTANVLWKIMKQTGVTDVSQLPFTTSPNQWSSNEL